MTTKRKCKVKYYEIDVSKIPSHVTFEDYTGGYYAGQTVQEEMSDNGGYAKTDMPTKSSPYRPKYRRVIDRSEVDAQWTYYIARRVPV